MQARLDRICRLLEITERKRHHKLLLFTKNLQELGASLFPYMVPVLPRPFPREFIKGEHFVLADLLKSFPGGSSQEEAALEPLFQPYHLPLVVQDPKPIPQAAKKKKKKKTG